MTYKSNADRTRREHTSADLCGERGLDLVVIVQLICRFERAVPLTFDVFAIARRCIAPTTGTFVLTFQAIRVGQLPCGCILDELVAIFGIVLCLALRR